MRKDKTATFRFYEELNDFLPRKWRKVSFDFQFLGHPKIGEVIEMLGVPHSEVDLIIINGNSVNFNYRLEDEDCVSVYPTFESIDISSINHLRPRPLRQIKFILDVHLGRLAKYLRICGFDCVYENLDDDEIIDRALSEKRIILTKDRGLLKNKKVTHSYWVRSKESKQQLLEIFNRFDLKGKVKFLVRCLLCNNKLQPISKKDVKHLVPLNTTSYYEVFYQCPHCKKIYWEGSHYQNMSKLIEFVRQAQGQRSLSNNNET